MIVSRLKSIIKVKWKIYFFTLQVLFYRIKNQTSKNVADTTFKLVLIGIWKTFGTANLWAHVTNFLHFLYYDCWKVLSGYLVIHIFYAKKKYIYIYIMSIMQTQPHLVCHQYLSPQDIKILGWCSARPVLPHGEKVPH